MCRYNSSKLAPKDGAADSVFKTAEEVEQVEPRVIVSNTGGT